MKREKKIHGCTLLKVKSIFLAFLFSFFIFLLLSCSASDNEEFNFNQIQTYKDIPGVTQEEINAIEEIKKTRPVMIYAASRTTELFEHEDGTLGGYTVLFCDWLSDLFDIQFKPEIQGLSEMLANLKTDVICFATLSDTPERRRDYFVTNPIAQRSVKILRIEGSQPIGRIRQSRLPRFAFTQGSVMLDIARDSLGSGSFEEVIVRNEDEAYLVLKDRRADAFIATNNMEAAFDHLDSIYAEDFYPLTFLPAAMVAQNPDFEPIVSVVTKALENGAYEYLAELYKQGYNNYRSYKFLLQLNDEEKTYIQNNPVIPFATQYMSYPVSFYDKDNEKWEGVVFDVLEEITLLSGLTFNLVNDPSVELLDLMKLLENGTAYFMPNLIQSDERKERFIWSNIMYLHDRFALLSKQGYPNIDLNDIPFEKIGFAKGSAFADMFRRWFPNALYAVEYPNTDETFMALDRGEVNLVMSSQSRLASLTNYYEFSDYKANYMFNAPFDASFGFNKEQTVLLAIIDKALPLINTERIEEQWKSKTYNMEAVRLRQQRVWFIGAITLSLVAFVSMLVMFININQKRKIIINQAEEEKQTALELDRNRKLLSAVNSAAAILLNTDIDFFENALHQAMNVISNTVDADRMYIWKNYVKNGELYCTQVYEWSQGAEPQQGNEYTVDIPYSQNVQGLEDILSHDQCLNGIVRKMPAGYQTQLEPQGIVSILIVPVFLKNEFWGFVGFDDCRNERIFTKQEEAILRSASLLFAHAYHRNEMLQKTRETSHQLKKAMEEAGEANRVKQASISSLENILNSIDAYIYAASPETGELLFANKTLKRAFGRENDNLAGEYCYKVFRGFDKMCSFCPCIQLDIDPSQTIVWDEYDEVLKRNILRSDCYIDWPNGQKVHLQHAVDITDLTRRKEAEEKARAESEAKSRFLANMSHEIRSPMNVILGSAESLLENEEHSKETREVLEKIYNSGDLLLHIINDILDLSKIEANKFEIIPAKYDITSLINDTINLNNMRYGQKNIKFNIVVDANLPLFLIGDELRIKQIINNLLSNAFKYTDSGDVSISFHSENTTVDKTTLVICVSDTGQGMTKEQVKLLFTEYTRFNMEANRTTIGTGLGMAITSNLVKLMNGEIKVESERGKGSVFTIHLPQGVADKHLLGRETADNLENFRLGGKKQIKKEKIVKEPMPYGKILIVDDMKSNLDVAVLLLKPYQLQIDTAESGFEAIKKVKAGNKYDIIFMDHMMPKMDGIETVKRIREWEREQRTGNKEQVTESEVSGHSDVTAGSDNEQQLLPEKSPVPIIALTANAIVGQAEMFKENGFDGCITKPIDTRELNAVLIEHIRNKNKT